MRSAWYAKLEAFAVVLLAARFLASTASTGRHLSNIIHHWLVGGREVNLGSVVGQEFVPLLVGHIVPTSRAFAELCAELSSSQTITVKLEATSFLAVAWFDRWSR